MRFALILFLTAASAGAQVRNFTIDAHPIGAELAMGWRAAPATYIGLGLGIFPNTLSNTVRPSDRQDFHDFEQLLFLDLFGRRKPSARVDVDVGVRTGIGGVRACQASDCLPGGYIGAFAAVFIGSARWKLGTRFIGARVWEARYRDDILHWEIISLRYSR